MFYPTREICIKESGWMKKEIAAAKNKPPTKAERRAARKNNKNKARGKC